MTSSPNCRRAGQGGIQPVQGFGGRRALRGGTAEGFRTGTEAERPGALAGLGPDLQSLGLPDEGQDPLESQAASLRLSGDEIRLANAGLEQHGLFPHGP